MTTNTYNGWTNYETWNVKMWIDTDERSCRDCLEMAREAYDNAEASRTLTHAEQAARDLADTLRGHYEDAAQGALERANVSASVWCDLLGAALSAVNWREIATSLLDEIAEDESAASQAAPQGK